MLNALVSDVRYSLRVLKKTPVFAAVLVSTLGLGIGTTTAMFSVVNGLLLDPLPFPDADRLVILWQGRRGMDVEEDWFSVAQYVDVRDGTSVFDDVTLAVGFGATLTGRGDPTQIGYVRTTSTYLRLLGATPALGRSLDPSDDLGDAQPVAVITYNLWETVYGSDPDIVGTSITLDGVDTEIVGVLSRDVLLDNEVLPTLGAVDPLGVVLSLPLSEALLGQRNREDYNIIGRLKSGVSVSQAQAELDLVAARIQTIHETDPGSGFFIRVQSLLDEVVGNVRQTLFVLFGAVGILLLIACGNVANLLFSRAAARQRELGIRSAVGADRGRLIRQLLTESAILGTLGGALGVAIAMGGVEILARIGGASLPRIHAIAVNGPVLAFALAATIVTCFVFGLLPAFRTSLIDPADIIKQGGRGFAEGGTLWSGINLPSALISAEVGLSLVLLIGGGLLGRSLLAIQDVDPGFEPDRRLTFHLQMRGPNYPADRRREFVRDLTSGLAEIPGVERVGGVSFIPFGGNLAWSFVTVPGYEPTDGSNGEFIASFRIATPEYFDALGIPVRAGRTFEQEYDEDVPMAVIIDEQIADVYYAGRSPIGQPISIRRDDEARVVGVVGSIKHTGLDDFSRPTLYLANPQIGSSRMTMVLDTQRDPETLLREVTEAVHALDPNLAVIDVATMDERLGGSLAQRRFSMFLLQAFATIALVLAAIGIYGLISYRVSQGTRDLGVRIALGAQRKAILRLVLAHGMLLAGVGVVAGLGAAIWVTRLMRSMLYGVGTIDGLTFIGMGAGLGVIALVACFVPAYRATRVDPLDALRVEG